MLLISSKGGLMYFLLYLINFVIQKYLLHDITGGSSLGTFPEFVVENTFFLKILVVENKTNVCTK